MAITVTKSKAKKEVLPKVEADVLVDPTELSDEDLADQYGQLEDQVNALKQNPVFTRFEEVQKVLAERLKSNFEPSDALTMKGKHWLLEIGVAAKNSAEVVDKPMIQLFLGQAVFFELAKFNLSDLKKYLTPEQLAKVTNSDTGYSTRRKITAKFMG